MNKNFIGKIKKLLENEKQEILDKAAVNHNIEIDIEGDEVDEIQGKILALAAAQLAARDKEKLVKISPVY